MNAVSPGITKTPMHPLEAHLALGALHPIGRMGDVADIVDAVVYLDGAGFVTGEVLHVDGGTGRRPPPAALYLSAFITAAMRIELTDGDLDSFGVALAMWLHAEHLARRLGPHLESVYLACDSARVRGRRAAGSMKAAENFKPTGRTFSHEMFDCSSRPQTSPTIYIC